jgi:hypothetical protein
MKLSLPELGAILFAAVCPFILSYDYMGIAWAAAFGLLMGAALCAALLRGFSREDIIIVVGGAVFVFAVAERHLPIPWALSIAMLAGAVFAFVRGVAGPKFFLKVVASILAAGIGGYGLAIQVHFGANAVAGTARVEGVTPNPNLGQTVSVVHDVEGEPVRATVQTYLQYPQVGSEVPVKYLPEKPTRMELDSLWERYLLVVLLFFPFAGLAVWEVLSFVANRERGDRGQAEDPLRVESVV